VGSTRFAEFHNSRYQLMSKWLVGSLASDNADGVAQGRFELMEKTRHVKHSTTT
jgi:hypothetical protein